ncbi:MAG: DNA polymerase III subunit beta [Gemmataceae bacterium]|nr:DNA polymerase III subunit beta [Gemmataceae bacterium]
MKIVCHREGLLAACQIASAAVAAKDVKPVLRNLKAIVTEDRCTLMATDLELGIRLEVRGIKTEERGDALLPTNRLISILRETNDEELTIEAGVDACVIQGKTTEFEMASEDPVAFPDIPQFAEEKYHELTAGVLRDMIRRTLFSVASAEHSRFGATTGILWELDEDKAILVGTDGRRLAMAQGACHSKGGHSTKGQMPVVPAKAMTLLDRNLVEPDELIRVSFRPNEVLIKTERAMIYSRLVEGRFPNYKQVLPAKHNARIPLTVGPFLSCVRQAAIMTDDESKRVIFSFAKKKLTLAARGAETGRSRVETEIDYDGKGLEISFDPKFIVDMLKVVEPDATLNLDLIDANSPAVFRQDPNYLYVVVPLAAAAT